MLLSTNPLTTVAGLIGWILDTYEEFIMCISCICGASLVIVIFLPESLHWQILNGKRKCFQATLREAATQNRTEPGDLDQLVPTPRSSYVTKELSLWSPLFLRPTLSLIFSWMFMSFIYYGKYCPVILLSIRILICIFNRDQLCHPGDRSISMLPLFLFLEHFFGRNGGDTRLYWYNLYFEERIFMDNF